MKQLHPKSIWLFFLGGLLPSLITILFLSIPVLTIINITKQSDLTYSFSFNISHVFLIVIVIVILRYIWSVFSYKYYKYELGQIGFKKEHGIIWKKYVTIPYDRIQNVDIYRGLLARILGLSDIQIQTAGGITAGSYGAFSEGSLPGVSKEEAEAIRDEVLLRARNSKGGQGL